MGLKFRECTYPNVFASLSLFFFLVVHEDKMAFAETMKRISRLQKTSGSSYVVLRHE